MFGYTENILEFTATAISTPFEDNYTVQLTPDYLFPGGGGQLPDQGTINELPFTTFHDSLPIITSPLNGPVTVVINQTRRQNSSLLHSGQHVLSAAFESLFSVDSSSFTAFENYATIELNKKLSTEEITQAENSINRQIQTGANVKIEVFETMESVPEAIRKAHSNYPFRLVTIAEIDSCGCCGTHVKNISELQICKILSVENVKNGMKIEFSFGMMAMEKLNLARNELLRIAKHLTTGEFQVLDSIKGMQNEAKLAKKRNSELFKVVQAVLMKENEVELAGFRSIFVKSLGLENAEIQGLLGSLLKLEPNASVFVVNGKKLKIAFGSNEKKGNDVIAVLKEKMEVVGGGSPVRFTVEVGSCYDEVMEVFKGIFK